MLVTLVIYISNIYLNRIFVCLIFKLKSWLGFDTCSVKVWIKGEKKLKKNKNRLSRLLW